MAETRTLTFSERHAGDGVTASGKDRAAANTAPPPEIPRYTIVRQIGRGGMGAVYEAIGPLGVRVALKVIHPEKMTATLLARFRQEARAMMELDHPHLARIYDYGEHDGVPYFTMKLLVGRTLADALPALRGRPDEAIRQAVLIADAVGYMHDRDKVHRDLKPNNILLDEEQRPYVSDFGLIKDVAAAEAAGEAPTALATPQHGLSSTLTQAGARLGTEAYMAPEQLAGQLDQIGAPTDVWALGVLLHELIWTARPTRDGLGAVDFPVWPGEANARLEIGVRQVISRCLALEPGARYRTANELKSELQALLPGPPASVPLAHTPTRRNALTLAAAGLFAAGAAGAGWLIFGRERSDNSTPTLPSDKTLAELQQEFAAHGAMDLLDTAGQWRWHEWLAVPGDWHPGPHPQGPGDARGWFQSPPDRISMIELARGLGPFRLIVEVAHIGAKGTIGVYAGRSVQRAGGEDVHCLIAVDARDFGVPNGPGGQPRVARRLLAQSCSTQDPGAFFVAPSLDQAYADSVRGLWTELSIGLDDDALSATWNRQPFKAQTRNQLMNLAGRKLGVGREQAAGLTPTFHATEGIGLYADDTAIAVRTARLVRPTH